MSENWTNWRHWTRRKLLTVIHLFVPIWPLFFQSSTHPSSHQLPHSCIHPAIQLRLNPSTPLPPETPKLIYPFQSLNPSIYPPTHPTPPSSTPSIHPSLSSTIHSSLLSSNHNGTSIYNYPHHMHYYFHAELQLSVWNHNMMHLAIQDITLILHTSHFIPSFLLNVFIPTGLLSCANRDWLSPADVQQFEGNFQHRG